MRNLVVGAGGQVGLDLARELIAQGEHVSLADLAACPAAAADIDAPWHRVDVTDAEGLAQLVAESRPDRVFHLAAILSARGEADPGLTYRVNQTGLYNALEAARTLGVRQFIFTSTIAVYGPGLPPTVDDDAPQRPTTMYGVTKASGELLGAYYGTKYGLDFRGVRFPGLISASVPGGGSSDYALWMYVDGVRHGRYEAFCRPDTAIPLMYMPDGIRALLELAQAPRDRLRRAIYNIAAFSPTAQEIADSVARALDGGDFSFAPDPVRQGILDSWPRALDDSAARADWDWRARWDLPGMTADLLPKIRAMLASDSARFDEPHGRPAAP